MVGGGGGGRGEGEGEGGGGDRLSYFVSFLTSASTATDSLLQYINCNLHKMNAYNTVHGLQSSVKLV